MVVDREQVAGVAEEQTDAARRTIARLEEQLKHTPKTRMFERGVIRYNLGLAWAELPTGERPINLSRAVASLEKSVRAFDPRVRPGEHARAQNALGTALRELGRTPEAIAAFELAVELVPAEVAPGEHGAARNNLGLALADIGRVDDAVEHFRDALTALASREFLRQRISVLHNLAQTLADTEEPQRVAEALDLYEEALSISDPQEHPYQWALVNHSLGVAYTSIHESRRAVGSFTAALRVFTRHRWPFQYALAKNNLGLSYAQLGDVDSLRRGVLAFEDTLRVLDSRLHRELWERAYQNLQLAERALADAGEDASRSEHMARLAASESDEGLMNLLRERLTDYTSQPEPRRSQALAELDQAVLGLGETDAIRITAAWLRVLMELPHESFAAGLAARMRVHAALDEDRRQRATQILDRTIQDELLAPQRVRVRDTLYEMGYERPGG